MSAANPHERHGSATDDAEGSLLSGGGYAVLGKMRWRTPRDVVQRIAHSMGLEHFDLDAAAEDDWHHAPRWITAQSNCLAGPWTERVTGLYERDAGGDAGELVLDTTGRLSALGSGYGLFVGPTEPGEIRSAFINPPWGAAGVTEAGREAIALLAPGQAPRPFPGTEAFLASAWHESRRGITVAVLMPQAFDTTWQRKMIQLADEVRVGPRIRFLDWMGRPGPMPPGGHALLIFRPHVPDAGWPGGPRVDWRWTP